MSEFKKIKFTATNELENYGMNFQNGTIDEVESSHAEQLLKQFPANFCEVGKNGEDIPSEHLKSESEGAEQEEPEETENGDNTEETKEEESEDASTTKAEDGPEENKAIMPPVEDKSEDAKTKNKFGKKK